MCTVNLLDGTVSRLDELSIQQTEKEHNKNNDDVEIVCLSRSLTSLVGCEFTTEKKIMQKG